MIIILSCFMVFDHVYLMFYSFFDWSSLLSPSFFWQGDANALRCCLALSQKIRGIMAAFPKDVPVISSHPIVGNMAVACSFKTVINLIFDNYPQLLGFRRFISAAEMWTKGLLKILL